MKHQIDSSTRVAFPNPLRIRCKPVNITFLCIVHLGGEGSGFFLLNIGPRSPKANTCKASTHSSSCGRLLGRNMSLIETASRCISQVNHQTFMGFPPLGIRRIRHSVPCFSSSSRLSNNPREPIPFFGHQPKFWDHSPRYRITIELPSWISKK